MLKSAPIHLEISFLSLNNRLEAFNLLQVSILMPMLMTHNGVSCFLKLVVSHGYGIGRIINYF